MTFSPASTTRRARGDRRSRTHAEITRTRCDPESDPRSNPACAGRASTLDGRNLNLACSSSALLEVLNRVTMRAGVAGSTHLT